MTAVSPAAKSAGKKNKPQRSNPTSKKHRWSAAERAAKGRRPRRRGGNDVFEKSNDRTESKRRTGSDNRFNRDERPSRFNDRDDRRDNRGRDERSDSRRPERFDRSRGGFDRDDRRPRSDRDARTDRGSRDDRGSWNDRSRNDGGSWNDRGSRNDRGFQSDRGFRNDRGFRGDRDSRNGWESRNDRGNRNDRTDRNDRGPRDDRGSRNDRPTWGRDHNASDRPRFDRRPERRDRTDNRSRDWSAQDLSTPIVAPASPVSPAVPEALETPDVTVSFADLGVADELVERLAADGITTPFPIQAASIPDAVSGRDVLGRGRTGSGKTLGFGLPLLTRLRSKHGHDPRALILLPTRELATQVADVLNPLARAVGLRTLLVAGGMSYGPQLKKLDDGVDVVIGTPGRLIDLMDRGALVLDSVQITVLDEADHMADLGFLPDVTTLLTAVPSTGQRMLFSATLDRGVDRVVQQFLHNPSTHQVDTAQASVDTMTHYLLPIAPSDKKPITAEIANRDGRTVIFVRTQLGADRVAEQLREDGVMAGALHGGLPQGARTRTLEAFKSGTLPVLVATDVAARGIHVDEVGLVLQVDPPTDSKTYLHRSGRTARAGETGVVVTLVLPNQRRQVRRLAQDAGVAAIQLNARPGDAALAEATGALPVASEPITEREYAKLIAPRQAKRQGQRRGGFGGRGGRGFDHHGGGRGRRDDHGPRGRDRFDRRDSDGDRKRASYDNGR